MNDSSVGAADTTIGSALDVPDDVLADMLVAGVAGGVETLDWLGVTDPSETCTTTCFLGRLMATTMSTRLKSTVTTSPPTVLARMPREIAAATIAVAQDRDADHKKHHSSDKDELSEETHRALR